MDIAISVIVLVIILLLGWFVYKLADYIVNRYSDTHTR